MGNSCVTGAGRSNSALDLRNNFTAASPAEQTIFNWTIDGFSSLLDKGAGWTYSSVFEIMGVNWYLKLNPRVKISGEETEYVSLRLELAQSSVEPNTIIEASFKFLIYDRFYGKHKEHPVIIHSFQDASTSSGTACMIALNTLTKQSSQFLLSNSCIFGIEFIKVATIKANTTLETLFVQKTSVFNESGVHTWEIDDFFAVQSTRYSPEFQVGGYTWFISTSLDGNHLSMYLNMKRPNHLPKDSANLVEVALSIKDQESGKHLKLAGRCQFSNNDPGWGFKKFISLEDFKDASKGYLIKGKCCIEAEVALVGSSKTK